MELVSGRDKFQPIGAHFNATRLYQRRVQAKAKFFFSLIIISHNLSNSNSIRAKTRELKAQGCNSSLQETSSSVQFTASLGCLTASSGCHEMARKLPRGSFWVELVSPRDEAVSLNSPQTVFFCEFLFENGLSCVFPQSFMLDLSNNWMVDGSNFFYSNIYNHAA